MADGMHISAANPSNTLIKSIISLKTYSTSRYWLIQKQYIKTITLSVILRRITSDYDHVMRFYITLRPSSEAVL